MKAVDFLTSLFAERVPSGEAPISGEAFDALLAEAGGQQALLADGSLGKESAAALLAAAKADPKVAAALLARGFDVRGAGEASSSGAQAGAVELEALLAQLADAQPAPKSGPASADEVTRAADALAAGPVVDVDEASPDEMLANEALLGQVAAQIARLVAPPAPPAAPSGKSGQGATTVAAPTDTSRTTAPDGRATTGQPAGFAPPAQSSVPGGYAQNDAYARTLQEAVAAQAGRAGAAPTEAPRAPAAPLAPLAPRASNVAATPGVLASADTVTTTRGRAQDAPLLAQGTRAPQGPDAAVAVQSPAPTALERVAYAQPSAGVAGAAQRGGDGQVAKPVLEAAPQPDGAPARTGAPAATQPLATAAPGPTPATLPQTSAATLPQGTAPRLAPAATPNLPQPAPGNAAEQQVAQAPRPVAPGVPQGPARAPTTPAGAQAPVAPTRGTPAPSVQATPVQPAPDQAAPVATPAGTHGDTVARAPNAPWNVARQPTSSQAPARPTQADAPVQVPNTQVAAMPQGTPAPQPGAQPAAPALPQEPPRASGKPAPTGEPSANGAQTQPSGPQPQSPPVTPEAAARIGAQQGGDVAASTRTRAPAKLRAVDAAQPGALADPGLQTPPATLPVQAPVQVPVTRTAAEAPVDGRVPATQAAEAATSTDGTTATKTLGLGARGDARGVPAAARRVLGADVRDAAPDDAAVAAQPVAQNDVRATESALSMQAGAQAIDRPVAHVPTQVIPPPTPLAVPPVQPVAQQGVEGTMLEAAQQQLAESDAATKEREARAGDAREDPLGRLSAFSRGAAVGSTLSAYGGRAHSGMEHGSRHGERGGERDENDGASARTGDRALEATARAFEQASVQLQQPPGGLAAPAPMDRPLPSMTSPVPLPELPDVELGRMPVQPQNASISLHHPDLGAIELQVHRQQGRVEVHALIDSAHAEAVLRANESGIRYGVQQSGMALGALRVRMREGSDGELQGSRPSVEKRRRVSGNSRVGGSSAVSGGRRA